jgi:hypothetical protein
MSFSYQSGSLPSPAQPHSPSAGLAGYVVQQFVEPERDDDAEADDNADARRAPEQASASASAAAAVRDPFATPQVHLFGLPQWLLRFCFRIRNTLAVYTFLLLCFNALLNVEIYREYTRSVLEHSKHPTETLPQITHALTERSLLQNLYIATLLAPLADLLARIQARNFFKLCLAKAMSHAGFAASLAQCTPSLNSYTLLILKGYRWIVPLIVLMDAGEIVYSAQMWHLQSLRRPPTPVMYVKLCVIVVTAGLTLFDACYLFHMRHVLFSRRGLPRHIHPVFVVWDANHAFRWSSPNSLPDVLEAHADLQGPKFQSQASREIRARIARWNKGMDELAHFGEDEQEEHDEETDSSAAASAHASEDEEYQQAQPLTRAHR